MSTRPIDRTQQHALFARRVRRAMSHADHLCHGMRGRVPVHARDETIGVLMDEVSNAAVELAAPGSSLRSPGHAAHSVDGWHD